MVAREVSASGPTEQAKVMSYSQSSSLKVKKRDESLLQARPRTEVEGAERRCKSHEN